MQRHSYIAKLSGLVLAVSIAWSVSAQQAARPAAQAAPPRRYRRSASSGVFPRGLEETRRTGSEENLGAGMGKQPESGAEAGPGTKGKGVEHQDARLRPFAGSLIVNLAFVWSGFAEGTWALTLRRTI